MAYYALLDFDGFICKAFYAAHSKKGSDKDAYEILSELYASAVDKTANYFDIDIEEVRVIAVASAHSWKKDVYPAYKAKRKKNEELGKFRNEILQMDPDIIKIEQLEADEVIIALSNFMDTESDCYSIIFSDDKDLKYYATNYCKINLVEKPERIDTADNRLNMYAQMLAGDKEDNITGIPKVGMVTAKKLLEEDSRPNTLHKVVEIYKAKQVLKNDCLEQLAMVIPAAGVFGYGIYFRVISQRILDGENVDDALVQDAILDLLFFIRDAVTSIYN